MKQDLAVSVCIKYMLVIVVVMLENARKRVWPQIFWRGSCYHGKALTGGTLLLPPQKPQIAQRAFKAKMTYQMQL